MSQENNQDYVTDEVTIERLGIKRASSVGDIGNEMTMERHGVKRPSSSAEDNQLDEESSIKNAKVRDEIQVEYVVKEEVLSDVDSEGEEYYILADDMDMVEISGDLSYLRAVEDPNSENGPHFVVVGASTTSNTFAAGGNNGQSIKSVNKSPLYLSASKEEYNSNIHGRRLDFSERLNLKNPSSARSFGNKSNDYDSEIVIYPVQNSMQNFEGKRIYLENTGSVSRKVVKNKENPFQISDCTELLQARDCGKIIIKSVQKNDSHPFKCKECGESFELKSHFVMHELGHEKYKFYSYRTNTVKSICVECKKPYLYSAKDKELNSTMCISCAIKLRKRMMPYNTDKGKENGTKHFLELPDISSSPKVTERKQCYCCGGRRDRYFVYGASLLCSQCWQDRTQKNKIGCNSIRTSLQPRSYRRHKSVFTTYAERRPFKSQVPNFQCQRREENPSTIGTHFLLSELDASHIDRVEEKDDDFEEVEDWTEPEISACEDESDPNTVILCDRTGEFIDMN